jgi:hypothetical protein
MTALPAISFQDTVLAIHIMAVVVAFGVTFAYPLITAVIEKADPRSLPALHRAELAVGQRLITPALAVVILAGIYLASKEHQWSDFYVQWGLGASIVIGALGGMFFSPNERRLIELSERDIAASGEGEVTMSDEYRAAAKNQARVGAASSLLVLLTIFFMATHLGA